MTKQYAQCQGRGGGREAHQVSFNVETERRSRIYSHFDIRNLVPSNAFPYILHLPYIMSSRIFYVYLRAQMFICGYIRSIRKYIRIRDLQIL